MFARSLLALSFLGFVGCAGEAPPEPAPLTAALTASSLGHPDGVTLVGDPSAVQSGDGASWVFITGSDGALWYRKSAAGGWGPWTSLGGQLGSSPSAEHVGPPQSSSADPNQFFDRLMVWARGADGRLVRIATDKSGAWGSWVSYGLTLDGAPTAVPAIGNLLTMLLARSGQQLGEAMSWMPTDLLVGGNAQTGCTPGTAIGAPGCVWSTQVTQPIGGDPVAASLVAAYADYETYETMFASPTGQLVHGSFTNKTNWVWDNVPLEVQGRPALAIDLPRVSAFVRDGHGTLVHVRNYAAATGQTGPWQLVSLDLPFSSSPAVIASHAPLAGTTPGSLDGYDLFGVENGALTQAHFDEVSGCCSEPVTLPKLDASCVVGTSLTERLQVCQSVAAAANGGPAARSLLDYCADAMTAIAQLPAGAGCRDAVRDFHFGLYTALLDRVSPFGDAAAPDTDTVWYLLSAIDYFYRLDRAMFDGTPPAAPPLPEAPPDLSTGPIISPPPPPGDLPGPGRIPVDPVGPPHKFPPIHPGVVVKYTPLVAAASTSVTDGGSTSDGGAPLPPPSPQVIEHARILAGELERHAYANAEKAFEAAQAGLPSSADPSTVGNAVNTMSLQLIGVDRLILAAAFAHDGSAGAYQSPLASAPLLFVLADAFGTLEARVDAAARMHDLGCRFSGKCTPASAELDDLYRAIAALPDASALATVLGAAPSLRPEWKAVLDAIRANHALLEDAAVDALGPAFTGAPADAGKLIANADPSRPDPMRALGRVVDVAAAAASSYAKFGLYDATLHNTIETGIQEKTVTALLQTVKDLHGQFASDLSAYKNAERQHVLDQIALVKAGSDLSSLQSQIATRYQQLQDLASDLAGMRLAARDEKQRQDDFAKELKALLDSRQTDPNLLVKETVPWPTHFTIKPTDGNKLYSFWSGSLKKGDVLLISVKNQWQPTCTLKSSPWAKSFQNLNGVPVGPEGYAIQTSNDVATIVSNSVTQQHTDYSDDKQSANVYGGLGWDYIVKLGASYSGTWDWGSSDSTITSSSNGTTTTNRITAAGTTGLRLPDAPYGDLPVGSLVFLGNYQQPETMVEREMAIIMDHDDTDLTFDVNDKSGCDYVVDPGNLDVTLQPMQSQGALVQQLGQAMGTTLSQLRQKTAQYVAEGHITPEETTELKSGATVALNTACNCDSSQFEPTLLGFFNHWVDSEIAEAVRSTEILQNLRQQKLLAIELDSFQAQLQAAQKAQALSALLPVLSLRDLPSRYLEQHLDQMASYVSHVVYPAARLRYPQTLTNLGGSSVDLSTLAAATWDQSFLDWADAADRAVTDILTAFDVASPPNGVGFVRVAYRFPRDLSQPNPANPALQPFHVQESSPAYLFPHADLFASQVVWDSLQPGGDGIARMKVRAEDLYAAAGGAARLDCHQTAPAIRSVALIGIMPRTTANSDAYTGGVWNVPVNISSGVEYPTVAGDEQWVLDPSLTHYQPRVYFIREDSIDSGLNALQTDSADALSMQIAEGLPPFAELDFDLSSFNTLFVPPSTLKNPTQVVSEWMLVFDLETKNAPSPMSWLGPCAGAQ